MEDEVDSDTNGNWSTGNDLQSLGKGVGRVGKKWSSRDIPNIANIDQNTDKIPGDFK